jgi:uncharacterized protein
LAELKKSLPKPTPETIHFWQGTAAGELRLQRCDECRHVYFPPRPFCPKCASRKVSIFKASGRATLYSYVINHRPAPGFTAPYAIAVVELAEGPRMMTNIVGCPQTSEALQLDMPLEVVFDKQTDEITLPLFKPAGA